VEIIECANPLCHAQFHRSGTKMQPRRYCSDQCKFTTWLINGPGAGDQINIDTAGVEIASFELRISPFEINSLFDSSGTYIGHNVVGKHTRVITFEVSALRRVEALRNRSAITENGLVPNQIPNRHPT
jgi:hypothetical protein